MAARFLLIKLGHLGDTLLLTPALRALREAHPDARIDVMVRRGCEVMLQGNPDLSCLLTGGRPESERRTARETTKDFASAMGRVFLARYDFAFDLSDSDRAKFWILASASKVRSHNDHAIIRSWKHRVFNAASHFNWARSHQVLRDFRTIADATGLAGEPGPLRFNAPPISDPLRRLFPWIDGSQPFAVVHPASRWAYKEWPAEKWARVLGRVRDEMGLRIVISTGPGEREKSVSQSIASQVSGPVDRTDGRLSIPELATLLGRARLFLGIDTVTMHLAAAMQTPTAALFGPSSEWSWHPWKVRHELVLGPCPCKDARAFACHASKAYPCMPAITEDAVVNAARRLTASP